MDIIITGRALPPALSRVSVLLGTSTSRVVVLSTVVSSFFGLQASEVPARSKIASLAPDDLGESGAKIRNGRGNCRLPNTAEVDRVATVGGVFLRGRKQKKL